MKDKTWMEFMNQKVGFFYCILTTHLTVVLKGHLPLVVCLVVCYCFCNELVYIIKSWPSGESLLVFFKYYIIDKFLNWKYQILFCILFRPMCLLINFFGLYQILIKCRTIWILQICQHLKKELLLSQEETHVYWYYNVTDQCGSIDKLIIRCTWYF